jgi:hypothetical protein
MREWTPDRVGGGVVQTNPRGGSSERSGPDDRHHSLKGSQDRRVRKDRRKTSKTRAVTRKVREGAGKSNDPLRRPTATNEDLTVLESSQALKVR